MSPSPAQIGAIHALAKRLGLSEDDRRAFLEAKTGKRSSRDLTALEAGRVIEDLKAQVPESARARPKARTVTGRWGPVLQALWLSGYNLGVVEDRRDEALIAFVERQTSLSHPRFMIEPEDGRSAIEALKAWLAREAKVDWGAKWWVRDTDSGGHSHLAQRRCPKRSVIAAQAEILRARGESLPAADLPFVNPDVGDAALDAEIDRLGRQIRGKSRKQRRAA